MRRIGNIGIDESNNGQVPCVYTGVYSAYPKDTEYMRGEYSGYITKYKPLFKYVKGSRDFKYIVFSQDDFDILTQNEIKVIALTELTKAFAGHGISGVLVDGELERVVMREMNDEALAGARLIVEPKADENYRVVNAAHKIAHYLFRHYWRNGADSIHPQYENHRIRPDISVYLAKCQTPALETVRPMIPHARQGHGFLSAKQ